MSFASQRFANILATIITLSLIAGCGSGSSDQPDLGRVQGKVTIDGEPLAGYTITFTPETGRPSFSVIESDGSYDLKYIRDTKGAKVGPNEVTVTWVDFGGDGSEGTRSPRRVPIPKKYSSESELNVVVKPGNNTFDFELESK